MKKSWKNRIFRCAPPNVFGSFLRQNEFENEKWYHIRITREKAHRTMVSLSSVSKTLWFISVSIVRWLYAKTYLFSVADYSKRPNCRYRDTVHLIERRLLYNSVDTDFSAFSILKQYSTYSVRHCFYVYNLEAFRSVSSRKSSASWLLI